MKKLQLVLLLTIFHGVLCSQAPEKMSYQAIVRNASNKLLSNEPVGIRVSILQGSASGTEVYVETHTPMVNTNGLVTLEIGGGIAVRGSYSAINWSNGPYFIQVETDPTGGTNYSISGTSELLAVPFALHAKTADRLVGSVAETDPVFSNSVAKGIQVADTARWGNKLSVELDGSTTNEIQSLSRNKDTIFLTDGGFILLPAENDPIFNASVAKGITSADTAYWNSKLNAEVDGSVTNELQTLSRSNDTLFLSNGGFVKIPAEQDPMFNASLAKSITSADTAYWNSKLNTEIDGSVTNEIQTLSRSNDTLFLSNGGFVKIPAEQDPMFNASLAKWITGADTANWNSKLTSEVDGSITNELQTLSRSYDTLFLSNGGFVKLPTEVDPKIGTLNTKMVARWNGSKLTQGVIYDDSVRVGIGTTAPAFKLEVSEDASFNGVRVGKGAGNGANNTAVGYQALNTNTSGTYNSAFGTAALGGMMTGGDNAAFGYASMVTRTTGSENAAFGTNSLRYGTAGNRNSAFGHSALMNNGGNNNTAIGYQAGNNNSTGNGNVFIGFQAGLEETGSNKLYISNSSAIPPFIYGDFASGRLGLGTISPTKKLDVAGDIVSTPFIQQFVNVIFYQ